MSSDVVTVRIMWSGDFRLWAAQPAVTSAEKKAESIRKVNAMKGAIVYNWTKPVSGREAKAVEFMGETTARLEKYVADGRISDYAWYISGHDSSGLLIMRGEMETLSEVQTDLESLTANVKGTLLNDGFEWGYYATGDTLDLLMGLYGQEVAALS